MQRTYQFFFVSLSVVFFFVRLSYAMDPALKEAYFWKSVEGNEKMLLESIPSKGHGFYSIKDADEKPIAAIDWSNDAFYTFYQDKETGTLVLDYRIKAAKKLLQLKVPSEEIIPLPRATQELPESYEEETIPFFAQPALPHSLVIDEAESEYGHAVEALQRSFRNYFVGEGEDTVNVRRCCCGCCLY